jgi:hypothetical protein
MYTSAFTDISVFDCVHEDWEVIVVLKSSLISVNEQACPQFVWGSLWRTIIWFSYICKRKGIRHIIINSVDELIITELVNKSLTFIEPEIHSHEYNSPHLDPIPSQIERTHISHPSSLRINFNITLPNTLRSPKLSLPFRFYD